MNISVKIFSDIKHIETAVVPSYKQSDTIINVKGLIIKMFSGYGYLTGFRFNPELSNIASKFNI